MNIEIKKISGWKEVLTDARKTVGKDELHKEPSYDFKRRILISEHSPIRNLVFRITWDSIPYYVAMHFRTHHIGFKSNDDDLYFVQTSRTDRTQRDRNTLVQTAPVKMTAVLNAQSIINISRVRLCGQADIQTKNIWTKTIQKFKEEEPILYTLCIPNCIYRGFCPELENHCGFMKTKEYTKKVSNLKKLISSS